ncbi:MAG: tetratricopeptide repeat protein [Chloroflexaceae bacterium]|jgi:chemotaxis protein methyltransferase CheR|nr:tetratricopeptide repeat protein [Chloroflexaceae bacterium]
MSTSTPQPALTLTANQLRGVREVLARYSGVYLDEARQRLLTDGLARRIAATGLSAEAYIGMLQREQGRGELQQLVELLLNHETMFLRNQLHMRVLREVVLPQLHRQKRPGEPLRFWSAGCATGEEPYSLAMMVLETFGQTLPRPVEIWATDLSETALRQARRGGYSGRALSNITLEQRRRYFEERHGAWFVRDHVRALVQFEQQNLMEPFPPRAQGVDIIFCQNVTIYFQVATCRALMERFYAALPPGGQLFLGFSETLWNIFDRFRTREIGGAFIYYKDSSVPTTPNPGKQRQAPPRRQTSPLVLPPRPRPPVPAPVTTLRGEALPASGAAALLQQARDLLDAGQAEAVLEVLQGATFERADTPQMLVLAARAHANRGDLELAIAETHRAIEMNPLSSDAYVLLGTLYMQQSKGAAAHCPALLSAARQLERARYLDPESALISFRLADVYRQLERHDAARREYRNTLNKLETYAADTLLDGVAVHWVRESCQRYMSTLARGESRR